MSALKHKSELIYTLLSLFVAGFILVGMPALVSAGTTCGGDNAVKTGIDLGCRAQGNPVNDLLFAAVRFLTAGVGVVIVAAVIVGGIQYITSQGEPQKQAAARMRVISAGLALLLFLFTFALLQWLVPGKLFVT
jgi:hypothetical protein